MAQYIMYKTFLLLEETSCLLIFVKKLQCICLIQCQYYIIQYYLHHHAKNIENKDIHL